MYYILFKYSGAYEVISFDVEFGGREKINDSFEFGFSFMGAGNYTVICLLMCRVTGSFELRDDPFECRGGLKPERIAFHPKFNMHSSELLIDLPNEYTEEMHRRNEREIEDYNRQCAYLRYLAENKNIREDKRLKT